MAELEKLDSQAVLAGFRILSDQSVVFQRHQDSMGCAPMQSGLGAYFADAQLLVIEAEAIENMRGPVDDVNAIPIR